MPELYRRVHTVMERTGEDWELVLVNDGSSDQSAAVIAHLCAQDQRVRGINLSRNFGFQVAVTAGLDMIAQWRAGYDVVYGVRSERAGETWFKRVTASGFYRVIRGITNVDIPLDTGDFRLMDSRVVEALQHNI